MHDINSKASICGRDDELVKIDLIIIYFTFFWMVKYPFNQALISQQQKQNTHTLIHGDSLLSHK